MSTRPCAEHAQLLDLPGNPCLRARLGSGHWTLTGDLVTIRLGARGFTMYLRQPPIYSDGFFLSVAGRGGISFAEQGYAL